MTTPEPVPPRVHYSDTTLTLLTGDAVEQMRTLPNGSVNCVVTSPPYYGLRDYGGLHGQIGLESSPAEYVTALAAVFAEVHRVLADDGTLWLNLGDSYASPPGSSGKQGRTGQRADRTFTAEGLRGTRALPPKNLLGIPWRVAFALQDAGWILRNAIVWHKPNAMPESVKDRVASRHEYLFLLTKQQSYWFDIDPIREPYSPNKPWGANTSTRPGQATASLRGHRADQHQTGLLSPQVENPLGRTPGDVWSINTRPMGEAHFATFPVELPRRCIAAGCKPDGSTVLDPFSGAGTTAMAAQQLGRRAIGIDLNPAYHDIALRRMSTATIPFGEPA